MKKIIVILSILSEAINKQKEKLILEQNDLLCNQDMVLSISSEIETDDNQVLTSFSTSHSHTSSEMGMEVENPIPTINTSPQIRQLSIQTTDNRNSSQNALPGENRKSLFGLFSSTDFNNSPFLFSNRQEDRVELYSNSQTIFPQNKLFG